MSSPSPSKLFIGLAGLLIVYSAMIALKGGLYLSTHEGDTLHLMDIVIRMAAGERIHQDFMTPIGVLAFAPIAAFVKAGYGAGHALIWAQIAVAAVLLPAVWWSVSSRLTGFAAWLTGSYMVVLVLALTYGTGEASMSMSMHYNRWAWTVAFVAILLAMLPPLGRPRPVLDGALIGLAMSALVLIKVTYFVAFAAPVLLALLLTRAWRMLGAAVVAGLVVAGVVTLWAGPAFWTAYIADLRIVAGSENRPSPSGQPIGKLLGAPAYLGVNVILLVSVVHLRQIRQKTAGLVLLLFVPSLIYVTWQNYGNDPQWLVLLVALLLQYRPTPDIINGAGWSMRNAMNVTAAAALAFAAPSILNIFYSGYRHMMLDTADYTPLMPALPQHHDLQTTVVRAHRLDGQVALDGPGTPYASYRADAERKEIASINGEELPACELTVGLTAWYETMAADLEKAGYGGRGLWETDLFNVLFLFGDFRMVQGSAPWYYGGVPGLEASEFVLVPNCPISSNSRRQHLDALKAADIGLREVHRSEIYRLYEKVPGGGEATFGKDEPEESGS